MKHALSPLLLALLCAGCVTVFPDPAPAPQVFRLDASEQPFERSQKVDWTISIAKPSAPRTLAGPDLVLSEGENRVAYVAGAEWAEPIPGLLQRALTAALDRSGKIVAVTPEAGARSDCELQWDLYAFDARQKGDSFSARFQAGVRLIEGRRRLVKTATQITAAGAASGKTARAAAAALTQAAQAGLSEAGSWALAQQCDKIRAPKSADALDSAPPNGAAIAPLAGAQPSAPPR